MDSLIPLTLAESGCFVFSAFESSDEANTIHLFECFEDENALNSHYAQAYTKAVFEQYDAWLTAPVEITTLTSNSELTSMQFHG